MRAVLKGEQVPPHQNVKTLFRSQGEAEPALLPRSTGSPLPSPTCSWLLHQGPCSPTGDLSSAEPLWLELNVLQPQTRHCVLCMKSDGTVKHWSMQCVGEAWRQHRMSCFLLPPLPSSLSQRPSHVPSSPRGWRVGSQLTLLLSRA